MRMKRNLLAFIVFASSSLLHAPTLILINEYYYEPGQPSRIMPYTDAEKEEIIKEVRYFVEILINLSDKQMDEVFLLCFCDDEKKLITT